MIGVLGPGSFLVAQQVTASRVFALQAPVENAMEHWLRAIAACMLHQQRLREAGIDVPVVPEIALSDRPGGSDSDGDVGVGGGPSATLTSRADDAVDSSTNNSVGDARDGGSRADSVVDDDDHNSGSRGSAGYRSVSRPRVTFQLNANSNHEYPVYDSQTDSATATPREWNGDSSGTVHPRVHVLLSAHVPGPGALCSPS